MNRFVEIMAPVFSRDAWRCVWHMIQVYYTFIAVDSKATSSVNMLCYFFDLFLLGVGGD